MASTEADILAMAIAKMRKCPWRCFIAAVVLCWTAPSFSADTGAEISQQSSENNSVSPGIVPGASHAVSTTAKSGISPYVVGAFYFGAFSPGSDNITNGVKKTYGRQNDWWGGVSDFYGQEPGIALDTRGWKGRWSHLKPAIGYYNQDDALTLEKQIDQAADAGLQFFSFYWYWSQKQHGERFPEALDSFVTARNSSRLRFNLAVFAHPWDADMIIGPENSVEVARRIVGYFKKPNYLRLPDQRPVLLIGDHRNFRLQQASACANSACQARALENFLLVVREATRSSLKVEPFIQIQAAAAGWDTVDGIDGVTCVIPPMRLGGGTAYPNFTPSIFSPLTRTGKPVSPCMLENFDERPRQDILIAERNKIRFLVGKTDALFRNNLVAAKRFSDLNFSQGAHPASRLIYLYAWNEWHEGGILEPNVQSGTHDLDIVSDVFQLPRTPFRCPELPRCNLPNE